MCTYGHTPFSADPLPVPVQLGFLYLRYVLNPRGIWEWLQYYIKDHEVRHALCDSVAC